MSNNETPVPIDGTNLEILYVEVNFDGKAYQIPASELVCQKCNKFHIDMTFKPTPHEKVWVAVCPENPEQHQWHIILDEPS